MAKFLTLSHLKIFFKSLKEKLSPVAFSGNYEDIIDTPELADVATSGDYNDLKNKPETGGITPEEVEQLMQDDLATVAFSGNFYDLTDQPTIPEAGDYVTKGRASQYAFMGTQATAEGANVISSGDKAHAEGTWTVAVGYSSHAEGEGGLVQSGSSPVSITLTDSSSNTFSHTRTYTFKENDIVIGYMLSSHSHAKGYVKSIIDGQHFILDNNLGLTQGETLKVHACSSGAYGDYAHVEGYKTLAVGQASHAEGNSVVARGARAHAEGYLTKAIGIHSHAEGESTQALGTIAHAEGNFSIAIGESSHVEGVGAVAFGQSSHAEGQGPTSFTFIAKYSANDDFIVTTQPRGKELKFGQIVSIVKNSITYYGYIYNYNSETTTISIEFKTIVPSLTENDSFTFTGYESGAYGSYSHIEGNGNTAIGEGAHAEGHNNKAIGVYSHVEGQGARASGAYSHAEGETTAATGTHSHAEGSGSTASGQYSHAEGYSSKALAYASHAEGLSSKADGYYAHAEGENTIANHRAQHVFGKYNIEDPTEGLPLEIGTYVEIVGNGEQNARSNARTLDWNGNEVLAGGLKVSSTGITIGNTTITEAQLQQLLGLLNS